MSTEFRKKLSKLEKTWKTAKGNQEATFKKVPPGKYITKVHSAQLGMSKNKDNPRMQVAWDFRVIKGDHLNEHIMTWDGIESDNGMSIVKGRLEALGVEPPAKLADIAEALDNACDIKCLLSVKKAKGAGDFLNVTILKRLKKKKSSGDDSASETAGL